MLQAMRSRAAGWFIKTLFFLLIVSFAVWGIGDIFRGRGASNTVAEVGDVQISGTTLDREFRQEMNRLRRLFGGQLDPEQARNLGLLDRALQSLINGTLQDLAANDAGLFVSDEMVLRRLQNEPAFRGPGGQFSREAFVRALQSAGMTEEGFIASLRRDLARQQLVGAVSIGAQVPASVVDPLYRYRNEQRVAETLTFPFASIKDIPVPTDAELTEYHKNHAVRFTAPEYRTLSLLRLTPADLAEQIEVNEADLRQAFDARREEFRSPERRKIDQARFDDEAAARRAAEAVGAGQPLQAAAAAEGGDFSSLGWVPADTLPEELGAPAFALAAPGATDPISTGLGWHVLTVSEIAPATEKTFDEMKADLAQTLRLERASERIFTIGNRLEDAIIGGVKLEDAGAEFGLKPLVIEAVDSTGNTRAGVPPAIPGFDQVVAAAFGLNEGGVSQLIELQGGDLALVRVDRIIPPELKPLADIRDEVAAAWSQDQAKAKAHEQARLAMERVRSGADLATVATELGGELGRTEPLTRDGKNRGALPQGLIGALFSMKNIGELTTADTPTGVVVARLAEIRPAEQDAPKEELAGNVRQSLAADLLAQFNNALRQRYEVSVDQRALDTMYRN